VRLVRRGHRVTVLTTLPNYPSGVVPPDYREGQHRREVRDGVTVIRVWSYIRPNRGFLSRILAQLSFGCLAPFLGGRAVGQPDVIIIESPPLFDAIAGRILARWKRCPYIFTVADIWPESAVQLGVLRHRLLIWLAERLEWSTYRQAGAVWSVTQGIRQILLRRGLPAENVFLLPNGVDTAKFRPRARAAARAELGWDHRFTILYAGTIGLAQGLEILLDAADLLREHADIGFVLIGEGAAKAGLAAKAERRHLRNVSFLDAEPHDRMPVFLSAADTCLVALRKVPLFEGALPSKMYEAMACARPILLAVDGEASQLVAEDASAAIHVDPENAQQLARAILTLHDQPDLAHQLGQHGRSFVEAHFDRDALTQSLEARLDALVGTTGSRRFPNTPEPLVVASAVASDHLDRPAV
jgi:glycosyltransferase involved in cell wall biosynthesis